MKKKLVTLLAALLIFLAGWAIAWEMDRMPESPTPTPISWIQHGCSTMPLFDT